jgi:hypothetical protein
MMYAFYPAWEAGSSTSTVALQVVGGGEKGTLFLGDLALQVWGSLESETIKHGHESRGTRT